jgi:UDP:flavonoid glycosyltransferase YjiC (YdhE family)
MSGRELLGGDKVSVSSGASAAPTMADLITGLAELDIELVATVSADQLSTLPDLPPHVRAVELVPLNELLPSCAAIVHHGGFGTVGNVLTHGLPSITVPAPWWDETDLGRSIEQRGAGLLLDPADVKPDTLRDAVHRLLSEPSFAAGARAIQDDLRATPSPAEVVRTIESWTADHRD